MAPRARDISGERFGRLVAVAPDSLRKATRVVWKCRCDCGTEVLVPINYLLAGKRKSCGCLSRFFGRELTGERFGKLTATEPTAQRNHGSRIWECRCDCGSEVLASSKDLLGNRRKSCGCIFRRADGDLTGQRFGQLVALEPTPLRTRTYVLWKCKCDCGKEVFVASTRLLGGSRKSCGCLSRHTDRDLTGERFGKMVVIEETDQRKHASRLWKCKCDCGKEVLATRSSLVGGRRKSCGCSRQEKIVDRTGQRFGFLKAIRPTKKRAFGRVVWRCKCDCGATIEVPTHYLAWGRVTSCGCKKEPRTRKDFINIKGERYGRLIAVKPTKYRDGSSVMWVCKCDCGNEVLVSNRKLRLGRKTSCGCVKPHRASAAKKDTPSAETVGTVPSQ